MTTISLDLLGLSSEAAEKLAELNIKSVEAFSSRVSDPTAAENLRLYINVDSATMTTAVERALKLVPPTDMQNHAVGGGLIKSKDPK